MNIIGADETIHNCFICLDFILLDDLSLEALQLRYMFQPYVKREFVRVTEGIGANIAGISIIPSRIAA